MCGPQELTLSEPWVYSVSQHRVPTVQGKCRMLVSVYYCSHSKALGCWLGTTTHSTLRIVFSRNNRASHRFIYDPWAPSHAVDLVMQQVSGLSTCRNNLDQQQSPNDDKTRPSIRRADMTCLRYSTAVHTCTPKAKPNISFLDYIHMAQRWLYPLDLGVRSCG